MLPGELSAASTATSASSASNWVLRVQHQPVVGHLLAMLAMITSCVRAPSNQAWQHQHSLLHIDVGDDSIESMFAKELQRRGLGSGGSSSKDVDFSGAKSQGTHARISCMYACDAYTNSCFTHAY